MISIARTNEAKFLVSETEKFCFDLGDKIALRFVAEQYVDQIKTNPQEFIWNFMQLDETYLLNLWAKLTDDVWDILDFVDDDIGELIKKNIQRIDAIAYEDFDNSIPIEILDSPYESEVDRRWQILLSFLMHYKSYIQVMNKVWGH